MIYATTCPDCGSALSPVAQAPTAAPWLCRQCARGWWAAELTPEARAQYRPSRKDFRPHIAVRTAVEREAEVAVQRGTSLRLDQIALVHPTTLESIASIRLATDFAAAIAAHTKGPE
jgi:hypothetical protein